MQEIYKTLKKLWEEFEINHQIFIEKRNKSAARRARKAIGEIKKLITEYRKQSVNECKK